MPSFQNLLLKIKAVTYVMHVNQLIFFEVFINTTLNCLIVACLIFRLDKLQSRHTMSNNLLNVH